MTVAPFAGTWQAAQVPVYGNAEALLVQTNRASV
jgi:hypothetical protein